MSNPTYQQVHIDTPLTGISVAYTPGNYIAGDLFPAVPVEKISNKYFIYTKADWLRDEADLRAPGTRAKRGGYGLTTAAYVCLEYAIAQAVPEEIQLNADAPLRPLEDATRWVTEKIYQKKETDVAALVFGNSVWSSSATPTVVWSNDTSDPLGDWETAASGIVSSIFRDPNTAVVGRAAWKSLKNHPDIVDRIKYSAGPNSPAIVTMNALAALIGVDKFLVGAAGKNTAAEGVAASLAFIWGSHGWLGYVSPRASLLTPSAGYIFTYQTRVIERFHEDQEHADVVTGRESWDAVAVATDAGYLLKTVV